MKYYRRDVPYNADRDWYYRIDENGKEFVYYYPTKGMWLSIESGEIRRLLKESPMAIRQATEEELFLELL